jgi:hypothetical protein
MGSRVETFEQIRRDRDRDGLSIRALAARHGVHRRAVREALASSLPSPRKRPEGRPAPKLGEYRELIDEWLIADLDAPRKQRHTAHRVWEAWARSTARRSQSARCVSGWPTGAGSSASHRGDGSPRARPRHRGRGRLGRGGRDPQRRPHLGVHLPYACLSLGWELRDGFPARDSAGVPRGPRRGV